MFATFHQAECPPKPDHAVMVARPAHTNEIRHLVHDLCELPMAQLQRNRLYYHHADAPRSNQHAASTAMIGQQVE